MIARSLIVLTLLTPLLSAAAHEVLAADVKQGQDAARSAVGSVVANFILPDASGKNVALSDFDHQRAVVLYFTGTGCPISNLYLAELADVQRRYEKDGVQLIGIDANAGVTVDDIRKHIAEFKVTFPALLDTDQRIADQVGAKRTAEVFLLDPQRVVRYHGRVDDRFGYNYKNATPTRHDLEEAIKELLAGKEISVPKTPALGCLITRSRRKEQQSAVTYAKEISRIVERRCVECHRPGLAGPFTLLSYNDVVQHADMIKEVVLQGRMPPWHADPRYGHWSNSRKMSQEEVDMLIAWIDAGVPLGDKNDLPPAKDYAEGWTIDKPDLVFELPEEVTIPADGVVPYQYYTVSTKFEHDVLIQAAEARPGNRAVVHHIIVFYRLPKLENSKQDFDKDGNESARDDNDNRETRRGRSRNGNSDDLRSHGHICGTAPGDPPSVLPPGIAMRIPAGAELVFQMHYTPTGKVEKDRSQVGFSLYKGEMPPKGYSKTKGIMNFKFEIPAGASSHPVESSLTFKENVKLFGLMPHMHLRGKDFLYKATYPDGKSEVLLSIPRYDFNWQNSYRFATPLDLPKGTRIDCFAHFDNSTENPANPDATKPVRWGDQTWEEMMIGWVSYVPENSVAEHATPKTDERSTEPN